LDKYDKKFAFSTWLFTVANNTLKNYFNKANRNREESWAEFFESEAPIDEQPEEKLLASERTENILRAVGKLSERQQRIIELKYWADLSNVNIAEILNLSASNVGYLHYQAIKKLRELLSE
jgi:RNA polymerase sigma factor, sigma-70 family